MTKTLKSYPVEVRSGRTEHKVTVYLVNAFTKEQEPVWELVRLEPFTVEIKTGNE